MKLVHGDLFRSWCVGVSSCDALSQGEVWRVLVANEEGEGALKAANSKEGAEGPVPLEHHILFMVSTDDQLASVGKPKVSSDLEHEHILEGELFFGLVVNGVAEALSVVSICEEAASPGGLWVVEDPQFLSKLDLGLPSSPSP